jgi:hypothetical protein
MKWLRHYLVERSLRFKKFAEVVRGLEQRRARSGDA